MNAPGHHGKSKYQLSVVIPTLGGEVLGVTLDKINKGTVKPEEIIICIPEEEADRVSFLAVNNIKVLSTKCRGQVNQRAKGFIASKNEYVLQLDDDILLDPDAIEIMLNGLTELGPGNVVGPAFYDHDGQVSLHKFSTGLTGFLKSLNATIFSSAPWGSERMGKVSKLGIAYGLDPKYMVKNIELVDWLPGGCVLSYKQDLICEEYFPLKGKAYSEDVVNSLLRKKNGIRHYIIKKARVKTNLDEVKFSWKNFKTEFAARSYVLKLLGGSRLNLLIWGFSQFLTRQFK